ncbi:MAG: alpha/beta fold hydrolase [Proteobacteria bacterium]|nr:alpha/beta fold hydrolase [Pseudomonadota bacterium]
MSDEVREFRVDVPEEVLADLRRRLANARYPEQIPGTGWEYGTELGKLKELVAYWRDKFDWRAQEARLNAFPQFETEIDGQRIHFIHARSRHENAMPLLISHGWPGSVVEFLKVIEPLRDPEAHGGRAEDAFHVICPSLPGYGFSGPTDERQWDLQRMADAFAALMARLGYTRYGAQGGDWGALITTQIGLRDAEHLSGIHVNMPVALPPAGADPQEGLSDAEKADLADYQLFDLNETGYQKIQGSKPQTLGFALMDSPTGLAAWILEKFRTWSDCGGDVESVYTLDELLANITVYWVTGTITSSTRLYYEVTKGGRVGFIGNKVQVPTGVARFPKEIMRFPRKWVENHYNVTHWTDMPRGGHFAAMEQPALFVEDVRKFFATVR